MINFLVSWAEQLIIALIIIVMIEMILPNSSYRKYIKLVLGLFVIYTIFSPLIGNKIKEINFQNMITENLNVNEIKKNQISAIDYNSQIEMTYKEKFKEILSEDLKGKGYEIKDFELDITYENEEIKTNQLKMKISKFAQSNNITIDKVKISDEAEVSDAEIEEIKKEISNTYNIENLKIFIESEKTYD